MWYVPSVSVCCVSAAGASIAIGPTSTSVVVNSTAFLTCQASRTSTMDLAYVWYFNDHLIDTSLPEYTMVIYYVTVVLFLVSDEGICLEMLCVCVCVCVCV